MKKMFILLMCSIVAVGAFAQTIDLDQVELSELDLTKADLSQSQFYFAGPVDLMVRGIRYMGAEYAALLKYDGRGNVELAVPSSASVAGLPHALDLSEVRLSLVTDGIRISNVIADGHYFAGKLVPTADMNLAVAPPVTMGGLAGTANLSEEVEDLQRELSRVRSQVASLETDKNEAKAELTQVEQNLADARSQISTLQTRLSQAGGGTTDPLAPAAGVTRSVSIGLSGAVAASGSWTLSGTRLRQTDSSQLYAKYSVPVAQRSNELVYTFSGTGARAGWSGYGMHFLASNARERNLYGYGSSYLVWVTRDPANTQSDSTFVQLYRSYDDVRMVQLASRAIDRPITSEFDVTVYVNRSKGTLVLGVDDKAILTFDDPAIIRSGSEVVARTLGSATVSGFSVRAR